MAEHRDPSMDAYFMVSPAARLGALRAEWTSPHREPVEILHERLVGAKMASESFAGIMMEALRAMVEAWFLLAQISPHGSLLERSEQAVEVLEQGIADLRYALNQGPEPD